MRQGLTAKAEFIPDNNFSSLSPKYNVTKEQIREYILLKLEKE